MGDASSRNTSLHRHSAPHKELWRRYASHLSRPEFYRSIVPATIVFILGLIANTFSIIFATEHASSPVTDLILSNTPKLNVDLLFVYGTFFGVIVAVLLCFAHPKRLPYALYTTALFYIIRSAFVTLTHIAPFEPQISDEFGQTINRMFFGADLFFSAHTGLPFLGALVFWHERKIRYFFLGLSVFFATIVLLGHLHYSIDVAAAYFITYTIFKISERLFPKERALFLSDT